MDLKEALTIIIPGFLGSLGFSLLFRMNKKKLPFAAIGGLLVCIVYVVCLKFFENEFFQNVIPSLIAAVYAEILARLTKAPSTGYLVISLIPLIPGGRLYYTIYYFITSDMELFRENLIHTMRIAGGLAVGIIIVAVIVREINYSKFKQIYDIE